MQFKKMNNSEFIRSFFLFLFFTCFSSFSLSNSIHKCSEKQSHALLLFKQNLSSFNNSDNDLVYYYCHEWLDSDYYPIIEKWDKNLDCCDWNGVTCDHYTGDVIGLDLSCGMLQGIISSNSSIFHLPHLRTLNLAFNDFTGSQLPREIGMFSKTLTHLNISGCWFSGQVPLEISLLHKLVSLDLSWNYDFKLKSHVFVNMLQNFTVLEELSLAGVNSSSVLPSNLNISSSLRFLNLQYTELKGKLPRYIFNLPSLEELDLSDNSFTGHIPSEITLLPKLVSLNLNFLSGLEMQPRILLRFLQNSTLLRDLWVERVSIDLVLPAYLNISSSLKSLRLASTGLKGKLPDNIFNLQYLEVLHLHGNNLTGPLPEVNNSIPLKELDLYDCGFSGNVPFTLFSVRSIKSLSLGNNKLSSHFDVLDQGSVVQTFRQLTNLVYLDLSYNNFRGKWELDTLLSSLTNLVRLDLSHSGLSVMTSDATRYVNPDFNDLRLVSCKIKVFPDSIRSMKNLRWLDLSDNEIHGSIPDWVGEIGGDNLYCLDLSNNSISHLPQFKQNIRSMKNLQILDLSDNEIHGSIPDWVGEIGGDNLYSLNLSNNFISDLPQFKQNGLRYLYLQSNQIQAPFPISICNMTNLVHLDMSNNRFGGVIPKCFGNIISSLRVINLRNNHFQGPIPNSYHDCGTLGGFILNGNHLEGEVPSFLSKCQNLEVIDVGNNHLNDTFPHWLGDLPNLQVLMLKSNNFHGPIITASSDRLTFQSLKVLDISNNSFVGQLPEEYFQNFNAMKNVVKDSTEPKYLSAGGSYYSITITIKGLVQEIPKIFVQYTIIDVSDNGFQGEIPNIIGSLKSLKVLSLSHNNLNGRIPYSLGSLSEIESLDLSSNQLIGEIPRDLANLKELAFLNLSHNHLVGRIPEGFQFNTFNVSSFGGNSGLCGFTLPKCEHLNSQQHKGEGYHDDEEGNCTWKVVLLGYGCGTIIGLVMGYLMLSTGKPKWFNEISDSVEHMILKRIKKKSSKYTRKWN